MKIPNSLKLDLEKLLQEIGEASPQDVLYLVAKARNMSQSWEPELLPDWLRVLAGFSDNPSVADALLDEVRGAIEEEPRWNS